MPWTTLCRSEDNTWEFVLSSYYASFQYCTQSTGFGSKHLYLLSHLSGPQVYSAKRKRWTDSGMCKMLSKTRAEVNMLAIHNLNIIILQLLKLRNYQRVEKLRIMQNWFIKYLKLTLAVYKTIFLVSKKENCRICFRYIYTQQNLACVQDF